MPENRDLLEDNIRRAARACRTIAQKCLREAEWRDAEEAFAQTLRQFFG
jgi:hypothetical protein